MRLSQFWSLMGDEFGASYAASLARDHSLSVLGSKTSLEAIEAGVSPREVWLALCDDMDVPIERRHGKSAREPRKA